MPRKTKSLPARFRLAAPDPNSDVPAIARIISDCFAGGQYIDEIIQTYIGNCHYDYPASRLVWDKDKLAHHWGVWGYPMRVESVELKVGGIGAVVTAEEYRKQGLMRQAALASFQAMDAAGYDLTILRGRHYVRYGYARAWNYVTYRLKPEEIPALPVKHAYRRLETADIPAMDSLYNRSHAAFSGTAVRPTYRNRSPEEIGAHGWHDPDGSLAGYMRLLPDEKEPKQFTCLEATGDPEQGLAVMAELFKQGSYETLAFFTLPHHHPILQLLRRGAVIVEDRYFDISGWRVKIINLHSILKKLSPLFETRLTQSQFSGWEGALRLDDGEQQATLVIKNNTVEVTNTPESRNRIQGGAELARLLIGSDDAEEIIRQAGMLCTGLADPLVRVLFPNLHPMMSHWDEY